MFKPKLATPAVIPLIALIACVGVGCSQMPKMYVDDSPAAQHSGESPTSADIKARYAAAEPRSRGWDQRTIAPSAPAVTHGPLYMEDPFEDKGTTYRYRLGWEDWVAVPYCYARFTLNYLMLPVSAVVTPPCTVMESDGELSEQLLGYDHDAKPVEHRSCIPLGEADADKEAAASETETT